MSRPLVPRHFNLEGPLSNDFDCHPFEAVLAVATTNNKVFFKKLAARSSFELYLGWFLEQHYFPCYIHINGAKRARGELIKM